MTALLEILNKLEGSRILIFVNQKISCDELRWDLKRQGVNAVALHGDLEQAERDEALDAFRTARVTVIVATDVAARGLDVKDVRAVVCYDIAWDQETHVHRIGRTGRAGASGLAVTFVRLSDDRDCKMAFQVFDLMEHVGQKVDPKLRQQLKQGHRTAAEKKEHPQQQPEGGALGVQIQVEVPPSDNEAHDIEGWTSYRTASRQHSQARVWDIAAVAQSLVNGSTYLRNPVEELLGHAAARDIASQIVTRTVQNGFRLLTHDSTGAKAWAKPFRWMSFRRVPWNEILNLCPNLPKAADSKLAPEFVWHIAVYELKPNKNGKTQVVNHYFKDNMDVIFDVVREQFAWLEDDDPQLVEASLYNEGFLSILKHYFQTGDISNPSHYHSLARLTLWPEGSLLHRCCEHGFVRCVEVLLNKYTPQSAPQSQPWLQLADPLWQEGSWGNSAFHSAAWNGHAEVMRLLWNWAERNGHASKVRGLKNKQRQSVMNVVEARLLKCKQSGKEDAPFVETFNVLARGFGKQPMKQAKCVDENAGDQAVVVLIDKDDARRSFELPASHVTLRSIVKILAPLSSELGPDMVDTVLLLRVHSSPAESDAENDEEQEAAIKLLTLLSQCRRVAFMKSVANPSTAIHLCRAAARLLRSPPTKSGVAWHSLALVPTLMEVPSGGSCAFASALEDLVQALRETVARNALWRIDLPAGTSSMYLPESHRHLPVILGSILHIKGTAGHLLADGPDAWQESELWGRMRTAFTAQNPLLKGPAALERKLLQKPALLEATTIPECLHPAWQTWMEAYADSLVTSTLAMRQWAPLVARRSVGDGEESFKLLRRMADEALLLLLKMRQSSARPGLNLAHLVMPTLTSHASVMGSEYFPRSLEYVKLRKAAPDNQKRQR
eukprot:gnl/TRDRNA2_/TRDRNA2_53884_c0_seq1.p1 gnl/TRDRNA2_/TRDRNA2_53884_c0~~gnl/TRDRNA2_/TRDRNA2_53884_c0_seq1.p1  ORF type:complete len:908 (+),score=170.23 gnl/TRDRNA2_/TRDRNA2_53884_c0_seq1:46-2724(+)